METSNSDANHVGLNAKNHRSDLGPTQTCNSGPKVADFACKNTSEGWDP